MVLLLPLLIVFTVKRSVARTHSLRYFRLGVSEPGHGIPEFLSVGYVDSHPITTYDSVSRLKEPRAPWMVEHLAPDHWERYTQLLRGWQQTFKVELERLQRHYNHSGFHTYQRMIGCEMLEDGSTTGFLQYAYDGQDFIIFDKDTLSWTAVDNVAHITKRAWEANWHELQYQKNWLEEECIAWLKRFLEYGKDTLQRTEPPLVKVSRKETFPGITTLVCRAYGFYPPEISMIWMKNGEEMIQEMDYGGILPSGDGTYQTWVSVELDSESSDLYSCHVEHCDVQMVLQVPQDDCPAWIREVRSRSKKNGVGLPDDHRDKSAQKLIQSGRRTCGFPPICLLLGSEAILLVVKAVSGSIVLAMILAGVGFLAWRRRPQEKNEVIYLPAPDQ